MFSCLIPSVPPASHARGLEQAAPHAGAATRRTREHWRRDATLQQQLTAHPVTAAVSQLTNQDKRRAHKGKLIISKDRVRM